VSTGNARTRRSLNPHLALPVVRHEITLSARLISGSQVLQKYQCQTPGVPLELTVAVRGTDDAGTAQTTLLVAP